MNSIPALKVAVVLAAGILLGDRFEVASYTVIFITTAILILLGLLIRHRPSGDLLVYGVVLSLGIFAGSAGQPFFEIIDRLPDRSLQLEGRVAKRIYQDNDRTIYLVKVDGLGADSHETADFPAYIRVIFDNETDLKPGCRIAFSGRVHPYRARRNPGCRDYRLEMGRSGIIGWVKPVSVQVLQEPGYHFQIREKLESALHDLLPARSASILTGMLLGDKSELPEDTRDNFRRTGLYHLLAVSGLHVGYLFIVSLLLIRFVTHNLLFRRAALLVILWSFVLLTGSNPPTVRAALMMTLVLVSFGVRRMPHMWNLLGAAALIILLFSPYRLFQAGFQLSFAAMIGVIAAAQFLDTRKQESRTNYRKTGRFRKFASEYVSYPIIVCTTIVVVTSPIMVYHFGHFALIGIFLNLLAIPLAGAIFGLAWVVLLLKLLLGFSLPAVNSALELFIRTLEALAAWGTHLPGVSGDVTVSFVTALILCVVVLGILLVRQRRSRVILVGCGCLGLLMAAMPSSTTHLQVEFLNVGQGDASLLRFPGGVNMLIDCGGADAGRFEVLPSLQRRGIHRIHHLVLSHYDTDHAGGARTIIENIAVDRMVVSSRSPSQPLGAEIVNLAGEYGIPLVERSLGDTIAGLPGAKCLCLWPVEATSGDENSESLVLKISFGEIDMLYTGDIGKAEQAALGRAGGYLQSDILKYPHHGSKYALHKYFLAWVEPAEVVITCGRNNPYGHPADTVVEALGGLGCIIHRMDQDPAIVYESDGTAFRQIIWQ